MSCTGLYDYSKFCKVDRNHNQEKVKMLLKNKFLPYIAYLLFFLLLGLVNISSELGLRENIFISIFCVILSSASYMLAVKKYKPILAWFISIAGSYLAIYVYFHTFRILLKPFVGKKGSQEKSSKKSEPSKSGHTRGNEANIERLKNEIAMYEKEYEEGMRSPSKADNEYAIKIHLPIVQRKKEELKYEEDWLKRNIKSDCFVQ